MPCTLNKLDPFAGAQLALAEAVRGISQGCRTLGIPVTGGNVSLYNQTGDVAIHPTPLVAVLGVMDDVARRTPSGWKTPGQVIYLLGTTAEELGGSAWTQVAHDHLGGLPPRVDLDAERRLGEILVNASLNVAGHLRRALNGLALNGPVMRPAANAQLRR